MSRPLQRDITATHRAIALGQRTASAFVEEAIRNAASDACAHAFLHLDVGAARAAARAVDLQHAAGGPLPPLAGLAIGIKDMFDVAGQVTAAGSTVLATRTPAITDSPAVARLRRSGAALIGRNNMTEFAYAAVGTNSHHGTPANAGTAALDAQPRIPGGSTSGGAVAVAAGAAWAALGSDTGGSIRIPAALQGLVGFKSTARLTPGEGSIPLSPTLDTVCAITRSVRDAVLMHELLAGRRVTVDRRPLAGWRLALASTAMQDGLDATVARAFSRTLKAMRMLGARIEDIALPELAELPDINAMGGFAAAESWAWHRALLAEHAGHYDPRVLTRILRGQSISAADYLDLQTRRADWQRRVGAALAGFDAVISPTVPIVAAPIAAVSSDDAFFRINAQLLRNPAAVNMFDGCAISLPCQQRDELPVGLMLWHGPLMDDHILSIAGCVEAVWNEDPAQ